MEQSSDLNQVSIFAEVIAAGSFTAAAKKLGVPKSTVSRKVSELETRLGVRLLERTTRRLRLTEPGVSFYNRSRQGLQEILEAESDVQKYHDEPKGVLRITAPPDMGQMVLGALAAEFVSTYPQTEIEIVLTAQHVDLVQEGFDLAVRAGILRDSSLVARKLASTRLALVAAPSYLKQHGTPQSLKELSQHTAVVYNPSATRHHTWRFLGRDGKPVEIRPNSKIRTNDLNTAVSCAIAGVGITFAPRVCSAAALEDGRLVELFADRCPFKGGVYLVYPSGRFINRTVRAFADLLVERIKGPF